MSSKYYIAYGSNLNLRQMRYRCPSARVVGTAFLEGWELLFKGSKTGSYLTIEPKKGSRVPVAVFEVNETDEQSLDRYEGYPTFYYKKDMKIRFTGIVTGKSRVRNAFVYIMHEDRQLGEPTNFYMRTCMEGYYNFGFDYEYLLQAYEFSKEGVQQ
jgi:gamma-glutamylcyclotransferase (GGCT)/AIG2-like uncharacterized protein YtfP